MLGSRLKRDSIVIVTDLCYVWILSKLSSLPLLFQTSTTVIPTRVWTAASASGRGAHMNACVSPTTKAKRVQVRNGSGSGWEMGVRGVRVVVVVVRVREGTKACVSPTTKARRVQVREGDGSWRWWWGWGWGRNEYFVAADSKSRRAGRAYFRGVAESLSRSCPLWQHLESLLITDCNWRAPWKGLSRTCLKPSLPACGKKKNRRYIS